MARARKTRRIDRRQGIGQVVLSEAIKQAGVPLPAIIPVAARRIQLAEASGKVRRRSGCCSRLARAPARRSRTTRARLFRGQGRQDRPRQCVGGAGPDRADAKRAAARPRRRITPSNSSPRSAPTSRSSATTRRSRRSRSGSRPAAADLAAALDGRSMLPTRSPFVPTGTRGVTADAHRQAARTAHLHQAASRRDRHFAELRRNARGARA